MKLIRHTSTLFIVVWTASLSSPEVKYVDLTSIQQRTELRYPAANCEGEGLCGGWGGGSIGDGAPDIRDPHALGVFLLRVTPTDIDPAEPFEAEFRVQNTGLASIEVPVSPHLSDLQPEDASMPFSYLSIALVVSGECEPQRADGSSVGFVELYGSTDHDGTVLILKPGEWIRVKAIVKLHTWPAQASPLCFRGTFWLRRNTFNPHPGGSSTEMRNLYPNKTPTPAISVYVHPAPSEHPVN